MTNADNNFLEMKEQLVWQKQAGIDLAIGEQPIDWLNAPPEEKVTAKIAQVKTSQVVVPIEVEHKIDPSIAQDLVQKVKDLSELRNALKSYDGCALKLRASKTVFGAGDENAKIMFIGAAPNRDEDIEGNIFVGATGFLLDKMLFSIGLKRSEIYLANILPWRPPGGRKPTLDEIATSLPFLIRQVELVAPDIIFTLGELAFDVLFDEKTSLNKARGKWCDIKVGSHNVKAMPSLHPKFLLKQQVQKRFAWQDLLALKKAMNEAG